MGMKHFCAAAKDAGADGVLLTDMIVEEAGEYLAEMKANGLAPVFLAAPTSPDARLKAIAEASQGFVYAISRVGITGTQQKVAGDAAELVKRVHEAAHCAGLRHLHTTARSCGGRIRRRGGGGQRDRRPHRTDPSCGCSPGRR
jgi:tryptophan synthase alpha subunit